MGEEWNWFSGGFSVSGVEYSGSVTSSLSSQFFVCVCVCVCACRCAWCISFKVNMMHLRITDVQRIHDVAQGFIRSHWHFTTVRWGWRGGGGLSSVWSPADYSRPLEHLSPAVVWECICTLHIHTCVKGMKFRKDEKEEELNRRKRKLHWMVFWLLHRDDVVNITDIWTLEKEAESTSETSVTLPRVLGAVSRRLKILEVSSSRISLKIHSYILTVTLCALGLYWTLISGSILLSIMQHGLTMSV